MAQTSTMHRFRLELADVDRGVYESLELRAACHPSETPTWLVTRVLAFALEHHPDLAFGRGLSDAEEPALWVRDPTGHVALWIDLGNPSPERLHKAAKRADRVVVYCLRPPEAVAADLAQGRIHRAEALELVHLPAQLIEPLVARLDRTNTWSILRNEGTVYVTAHDVTHEGVPRRRMAVESPQT